MNLANMRGWEWLFILAIILLLFGARKLPDLARGLGQSIKEFRKGARDGDDAPERGEIPPPGESLDGDASNAVRRSDAAPTVRD